MTGVSTTSRSRHSSTAAPNRAIRLRANRAKPSRMLNLYARVEHDIDHVDGEVDDHDQTGRHEEDCEKQVEVARLQRVEGKRADAGPAEYGFHDDGTADQIAGLNPGQSHDRQHRVAQYVTGHDAALGLA